MHGERQRICKGSNVFAWQVITVGASTDERFYVSGHDDCYESAGETAGASCRAFCLVTVTGTAQDQQSTVTAIVAVPFDTAGDSVPHRGSGHP